MESILSRLANMFKLSEENIENIFNTVRKIRMAFLDVECAFDYLETSYNSDPVESQIIALEQELKVQSHTKIYKTMESKDLENAAEVFLYLKACPVHLKPWILFYEELFETKSPEEILLTLNRISKGSYAATPESNFSSNMAKKLLRKARTLFSLQSKELKSQQTKNRPFINHPVHIVTEENKTSPSALIPFCELGGNMTTLGTKMDQFDIPVCKSFQTKIFNSQLCYEVDLNLLSQKQNIEKEIKSGFAFIMDYNEDRQMTPDKDDKMTDDGGLGLVSSIVETDHNQDATIYVNTIGIN